MAAPTKYPETHKQLRALAEEARAADRSFDDFWEAAIRPNQPPVTWATDEEKRPPDAIVWPRDTMDRNISIGATLGAREGWRRAYERLPAPKSERALAVLRPGLEALERVGAERAEAELAAA